MVPTSTAAASWYLVLSWAVLTNSLEEAVSCPEVCSCFERNNRSHVDCSNRGLSALPLGISFAVQVFDLSNNFFESYPPELLQFGNIESLNFAGNQLTEPLPRYFDSLLNLRLLNLTHNKYDRWENHDIRSTSLTELDLSKNFISRLHETSFVGMPSLQYLDLSENRLTALPRNLFQESDNLNTLVLSRNYFDHIPKFESTSLQNLDLSMCQITNLPVDSFDGKTSLLVVDLSTNQIDSIPDLLRSETIQSLDLSYNTIQTINANTFRNLPNLEVLGLSGNEFEKIWTPQYFSGNKHLREVRINGNRWGCEGFGVNLLVMYDYLTRDTPRVPDPSALICYTPANVTGWSWQRAYVDTWHVDSDDSIKYASVLIGVIIGVVITTLLCRISMKKKLHELESRQSSRTTTNGSSRSGATSTRNHPETQITIETVDIRIPLRTDSPNDMPPTYDEALLMPRLDGSFHSLPDYLGPRDSELAASAGSRLSRSINDLLDESSTSEVRNSRVGRNSRRIISTQLAQSIAE